jgi:hypothetical protein
MAHSVGAIVASREIVAPRGPGHCEVELLKISLSTPARTPRMPSLFGQMAEDSAYSKLALRTTRTVVVHWPGRARCRVRP